MNRAMSVLMCLDSLTEIDKQRLDEDLVIEKKPKGIHGVGRNRVWLVTYLIEGIADILIPFAYANSHGHVRKSDTEDEGMQMGAKDFRGSLRKNQKDICSRSMDILTRTGSCVLSLYVGFGKSISALYLSRQLGLKTLIIVHRIVLIHQWTESVLNFCGSESQLITSASDTTSMVESDFYIVNASVIAKLGRFFFRQLAIGTVIADEVHLLCSDVFSNCFKYLAPKYMIALSATPYRADGLDRLIDLYFGVERLEETLTRKHTVYEVQTDFKPDIKYNFQGKVDWNALIESQTSCLSRNKMIVDLVCYFKERTILVLCKRVNQARWIREELTRRGEDRVSDLIGKTNTYDPTCRVLVATASKVGVGFSYDALDMLVLASDIKEYFIQYFGRVMRTPHVEPIVIDIIDSNPILHNHYKKERRKVYLSSGGTIIKVNVNMNKLDQCFWSST